MKMFFLFMTLLLVSSGCLLRSKWDGETPLTSFSSRDGDYFPQFIKNVFKHAESYERDYQTRSLAAQDIRVIQIQKLVSENTRHNEANLSWSADGVYLSYEIEGHNKRSIRVKDLVGNYSKELAVIPAKKKAFFDQTFSREIQSFNAGLSWSKDSTRYAFMSNGGNGTYNIYLGAIGVKEHPVAQSSTKDGFATWSSHSDEIAFVSARTGNGDIYLLNTEKKILRQLSFSNKVDLFPEWSPSSNAIVFASGKAASHNIFRIRRLSRFTWSKPERITNWPHNDLRPKISPNGLYMAFYSDSGEIAGKPSWNIHVVRLDRFHEYQAHELRKTIIAENVVVDINTGPTWSPDGKKVLYVKKDSALMNPICAYNIFTGKRFRLNTGTKMNRDIMISKLGVLSFRAQVGVWDKVFVALTNQGLQLQSLKTHPSSIHYL